MIKVRNRPSEPLALQMIRLEFTADLINARTIFNKMDKKDANYAAVKENLKLLEGKYGIEEVKVEIAKMSTKSKCVYCERITDATDYFHIEHFYPKSRYPEFCFEWTNLFVGCRRCNQNGAKGDLDTLKTPILHPENDFVEKYLAYSEFTGEIEALISSVKFADADRTILVCNLKRERLNNLRITKIINFKLHENGVKDALRIIDKEVIAEKRSAEIVHLFQSLILLKNQANDDQEFAGLFRYLYRNSPIMNAAKDLINKNQAALGLTTPFDWSW
jgi:uncharacterized protein (TIGR02646 family)